MEKRFNSYEREALVPLGNNTQRTWPNPKGPGNPGTKTRHKDINNLPKNIIPGQLINKAYQCTWSCIYKSWNKCKKQSSKYSP